MTPLQAPIVGCKRYPSLCLYVSYPLAGGRFLPVWIVKRDCSCLDEIFSTNCDYNPPDGFMIIPVNLGGFTIGPILTSTILAASNLVVSAFWLVLNVIASYRTVVRHLWAAPWLSVNHKGSQPHRFMIVINGTDIKTVDISINAIGNVNRKTDKTIMIQKQRKNVKGLFTQEHGCINIYIYIELYTIVYI